ncbi:GNAT family N-acetyltransferase [Nibribacter ruber]|uniref:GNAT family N-acetyltransferase n=1 Tax=Nibribacter ruber TaxID=2698458 RepID=A0A6P1NW69_9BACT|nr:GNAT family N-acetyltransferase [Nibribacter ruber]QHL88086.1 GNAT family N-acetyltransferase [Nibribacter ruber]
MIELSQLDQKHLPYFLDWINDQEVIKYSLSAFHDLSTEADITQWFEGVLQDTESMNLAIIDTETQECLGYATISNMSEASDGGEFFLFIGDKSAWGKGIGTEVTRQMVEKGFTEQDLHWIILVVSKSNRGGVKAYQRAGFTIETMFRQRSMEDGKLHDTFLMSIRREEQEAA